MDTCSDEIYQSTDESLPHFNRGRRTRMKPLSLEVSSLFLLGSVINPSPASPSSQSLAFPGAWALETRLLRLALLRLLAEPPADLPVETSLLIMLKSQPRLEFCAIQLYCLCLLLSLGIRFSPRRPISDFTSNGLCGDLAGESSSSSLPPQKFETSFLCPQGFRDTEDDDILSFFCEEEEVELETDEFDDSGLVETLEQEQYKMFYANEPYSELCCPLGTCNRLIDSCQTHTCSGLLSRTNTRLSGGEGSASPFWQLNFHILAPGLLAWISDLLVGDFPSVEL
ncbi:unnamed protein product, partial [Protopolystoma xenopodis]